MTIGTNLRRWYEGEFVPYENSPGSDLIFVGGSYRRHWSSRLAHVVVDFYLKEWRWLIPLVAGIATAIAAIIAKQP